MTKRHTNTLTFSIFLSLIVSVTLYLLCPTVVNTIDEILENHNLRMYNWILYHGVFALTFGLIPLVAFIAWRFALKTSSWSLFIYNIILFLMINLISVIPAIYLVQMEVHSRPSLSSFNRNIRLPSAYFWNYVFIGAFVLGSMLLFTLAIYNKRKIQVTGNAKSEILDNLTH